MIFAQQNGRQIPKEDKIFGISSRAKARIAEKGKDNVINGTIGALIDDDGQMVVLQSVIKALKELSPEEFAEYAPIGGTPAFKEAVIRAAFGNRFTTDRVVRVCATPGGTGAIRNTISNYSCPGDTVLTSDWFWAPYKTISQEIGRSIDTYEMFTADGKYNVEALDKKVNELMDRQGRLVIIINTPAHNPTGYSLTDEDWQRVMESLNKASEKGNIALLADVAYMDFAGDEEEYRSFLSVLEKAAPGVLPIIGYSASKTLTLYGMRCGAMICLAPNEEIAEEFRQVTEFSSRGSWSNCVRAGQTVLAKVYGNKELMDEVGREREGFRMMLLQRGKMFEETLRSEGLENVPFDAGFFTCIACDNPDEISQKLAEQDIFVVPLAKGIRLSVASISEEKCVKAAKVIARVMK